MTDPLSVVQADTESSLKLQMAEVEMLTSMYPDESEFTIDDPAAITHITDFIEGKTKDPPPRMDFTIYIKLEEDRLELSCSLPQEYPLIQPEVYVRSPSLSREQQHKLNDDLTLFQSGQPIGELCVLTLTQWLADNAGEYVLASKHRPTLTEANVAGQRKQTPQDDTSIKDDRLTRLWIYSHHIYNKGKRGAILELAEDFNLSGFCLPGKPGIICAEGYGMECEAFWTRVKRMKWKKIMLKKTEISSTGTGEFRKFGPFQEVCFKPRPGPGREYHMDMGEFFKFLEERNCGYVFKDYFGVDGESSFFNGH